MDTRVRSSVGGGRARRRFFFGRGGAKEDLGDGVFQNIFWRKEWNNPRKTKKNERMGLERLHRMVWCLGWRHWVVLVDENTPWHILGTTAATQTREKTIKLHRRRNVGKDTVRRVLRTFWFLCHRFFCRWCLRPLRNRPNSPLRLACSFLMDVWGGEKPKESGQVVQSWGRQIQNLGCCCHLLYVVEYLFSTLTRLKHRMSSFDTATTPISTCDTAKTPFLYHVWH